MNLLKTAIFVHAVACSQMAWSAETRLDRLLQNLRQVTREDLVDLGRAHDNCVFVGNKTILPPLQSHWPYTMGTFVGRCPGTFSEIVALGAKAVPSLVEHLSDAAPTRARIECEFVDPFFDHRGSWNDAEHFQNFEPGHFTVTVGDLCFFLLGQIVNRDFGTLRPFTFGDLAGNCPSLVSGLAKAAEADWGGTTRESLRASLIQDVRFNERAFRDVEALLRLELYYPGKYLVPIVISHLSLPFSNRHGIEGATIPTSHARLWTLTSLSADQWIVFLRGVTFRNGRIRSFLIKRIEGWLKGADESNPTSDCVAEACGHLLQRYPGPEVRKLCQRVCDEYSADYEFRELRTLLRHH